MRNTFWDQGNWNTICDCCGLKRKSNQLQERWDGFMVCKPELYPGCWEPRHPQDMIRPIREESGVPWTRPESNDNFAPAVCSVGGRIGVAGIGTAGCAIAGTTIPPGYGPLELGVLPASNSY